MHLRPIASRVFITILHPMCPDARADHVIILLHKKLLNTMFLSYVLRILFL